MKKRRMYFLLSLLTVSAMEPAVKQPPEERFSAGAAGRKVEYGRASKVETANRVLLRRIIGISAENI